MALVPVSPYGDPPPPPQGAVPPDPQERRSQRWGITSQRVSRPQAGDRGGASSALSRFPQAPPWPRCGARGSRLPAAPAPAVPPAAAGAKAPGEWET